jgi:hypothetical protein
MRQNLIRLFLVLVFLSAIPAQAQQPVLTILYTANTYGVTKPCPS